MQKIGRPTPGRAAAKSKPVPTCEHVTQRRRAAHLRACPGNSLRAKCVGRRGMSLRYRQLLRARAAHLVSGKLARQYPGEPCAAGSSPKRPAKHASREQSLGSGVRACDTVEKRRENACPLPCLFASTNITRFLGCTSASRALLAYVCTACRASAARMAGVAVAALREVRRSTLHGCACAAWRLRAAARAR